MLFFSLDLHLDLDPHAVLPWILSRTYLHIMRGKGWVHFFILCRILLFVPTALVQWRAIHDGVLPLPLVIEPSLSPVTHALSFSWLLCINYTHLRGDCARHPWSSVHTFSFSWALCSDYTHAPRGDFSPTPLEFDIFFSWHISGAPQGTDSSLRAQLRLLKF